MPTASTGPMSPSAQGATASALDMLADLAHRYHLTDVERRCSAAAEQAGTGRLSVAVLGQFKAGKSSLLNALLGQDVLPVSAIPATAVVTEVGYGATPQARVTRVDGTELSIATTDLDAWVTEEGNPDNAKNVSRVTVDSPALADLDRMILVDTPGTGSSIEHNTRTSVDWLPRVQAAIVAIAVTQPLAAEDLALIAAARRHTPRLVIVLTKVDLVTEKELPQIVDHVTSRLGSTCPIRRSCSPSRPLPPTPTGADACAPCCGNGTPSQTPRRPRRPSIGSAGWPRSAAATCRWPRRQHPATTATSAPCGRLSPPKQSASKT